jgi:large subunit ribosomal protein L10
VNRAEKTAVVEELNALFGGTPHVILASFSGLSVNGANDLRARIRSAGGSYRVIKNRLAKRAAEGTPVQRMAESFSGPCAIAWHADDPVGLAKALADFIKDNPQIELLAGVIDARDELDAAGVKQLSRLPGLLELRAQLLSLIQTPGTTLVRLIQTPGAQLARVVDARREAQEAAG